MSRPLRADARRNRAKILAAAEQVFAEGGPEASTEEVARRAGVAAGTVFRHFPTKADLLRALMKDLLEQVTADAAELATSGDPATGLFEFFGRLVRRTAANRTVVGLLAVPLSGPITSLADVVAELLRRAQEAGAVRLEVRPDEVMALLESTCQGALSGAWTDDLRDRTLEIIFFGLRAHRPLPHPGTGWAES
ncbi:TetR/AcrR family transcriptional regulator [Actinoplanes sp. NBRC 103695]|uniref:TetR/AcrR family transcriptional regulator n=1 Tax=Actinoplanes sp. NBRC 103695 TaxID=3032202 RepID=UPI0024A4D5A3|nr:TetR/AcrR family transcriptional regulator [Actinoplanes sp. NBRC 103695]GLZ00352.1 TetR family transcriptional regulator [Actinoplanes sp. NBRC 103695]